MSREIRQFHEQGYLIKKSAFDRAQIAQICDGLELLKTQAGVYYSQATHRYKLINVDEFGFLEESMLGFSRNWQFGKNMTVAADLLLSKEMRDHLGTIFSDDLEFVQQNNMLFDRSMETVDHIDSWYLDTHPKGQLVGALVALEDIDHRSGPFRVFPGSHQIIDPYELQELDHDSFIARIDDLKRSFKPRELLLRKGDLVFWHSCLIHGASPIIDRRFSRKSLTAHYFPLHMKTQASMQLTKRPPVVRLIKQLLKYPNRRAGQSIYQYTSPVGIFVENLMYLISKWNLTLRSANSSGSIRNDMRSRSYDR